VAQLGNTGGLKPEYYSMGKGKLFNITETNKLSIGLYLTLWTTWENFCRELFVIELAESPESIICSRVKKFRNIRSAEQIAQKMAEHIDHPSSFFDWHDFAKIIERSKLYIGDTNVFTQSGIDKSKLKTLFKIRNRIAHNSDKAKDDFIKIITGPPFELGAQKRQGMSPGSLLCAKGLWPNRRPNEPVFIGLLEIIVKNIEILIP